MKFSWECSIFIFYILATRNLKCVWGGGTPGSSVQLTDQISHASWQLGWDPAFRNRTLASSCPSTILCSRLKSPFKLVKAALLRPFIISLRISWQASLPIQLFLRHVLSAEHNWGGEGGGVWFDPRAVLCLASQKPHWGLEDVDWIQGWGGSFELPWKLLWCFRGPIQAASSAWRKENRNERKAIWGCFFLEAATPAHNKCRKFFSSPHESGPHYLPSFWCLGFCKTTDFKGTWPRLQRCAQPLGSPWVPSTHCRVEQEFWSPTRALPSRRMERPPGT
jgi:hypothetical protein